MFPEKIYYEPSIFDYELGAMLKEKYRDKEWIEIVSHNNIPALRGMSNSEFAQMKRFLIIGTRKSLKYVENHKISDYLVPYTSSGCSAMCLYCYLVCNYNKCAYMRLFVNREEMMEKLKRTAVSSEKELVFEIGSNSDLVLENTVTNNLSWTIEEFAKMNKGYLTFPTKFALVDSLLNLDHRNRIIFRMSVNPKEIIKKIEIGTASLEKRVEALNKMANSGYKCGILIAPVVLEDGYREKYSALFDYLNENLCDKIKENGFIEVIFMTYSFVHHAINTEAFTGAPVLLDKEKMTGRGRGRYLYRQSLRGKAEEFIREELSKKLGLMKIEYIV